MKIREMLEKRINEKRKENRARLAKKVTAVTMAGIAAGIVGGVLIAPKSGRETRNNISKTAKDLSKSAITSTVKIKEIMGNKLGDTKINANIAKERIAKYLSDKKAERYNSKIEDQDEVAIEGNSIQK